MSHAEDNDGTRRDFLYYATAGAGVVATGAAVWPLINQMNPSADVRGLSSIFVDVSAVEVGTQLTVKWRGKPVFIRRRTPEEIDAGRSVPLTDLVDTNAENANKPGRRRRPTQNRTLDEAGEWLVMMGVCTHLGCVPLGDARATSAAGSAPATARTTTRAGRIRKGPAPRNLTFRLRPSPTKPRSSSGKEQHHGRNSARPLRAQDGRRKVAASSACRSSGCSMTPS